ncbi:MAG: hypothetical protein M9910_00800 [Kiritimatiellae bacterium]|nr:hypothetical protein [Kiritimatiellia bacterium]
MKREVTKPVVVKCTNCGFDNVFNQPHPYHAGFGNQGFLYNEKGNRTLVWSSFDPDYERVAGNNHPWVLGPENKKKLEAVLQPDPNGGGRWLFDNPARCLKCGNPISAPIGSNIYYLEYDGSINLDPIDNKGRGLKEMMRVEPAGGAYVSPAAGDPSAHP